MSWESVAALAGVAVTLALGLANWLTTARKSRLDAAFQLIDELQSIQEAQGEQITYLRNGIAALIHQIESSGMCPVWRPGTPLPERPTPPPDSKWTW